VSDDDIPEQHPVVETIESFEMVFDIIAGIGAIGQLSPLEDLKLSKIAKQIHNLHEEFGDRVRCDAGDEDPDLVNRRFVRLTHDVDEGESEVARLALKQLGGLPYPGKPN